MKIVFIPNLPYTYRDHKRFGVEFFLEKGYDTEVMDIHKVLLPGYKEKVDIEYFTFDNHWEPESIDEIVERVKKLSKNDFVFFYIAGFNAIKLLKEMKKHTQAKFITYVGASIPTTTVSCTLFDSLKKQVKNFVKRFIPKYQLKFDTDYYVAGAPKDEIIFSNLITKNTKIIKSNSRDYNLCLKSKPYENEKQYSVFLDTDAIDASDYVLFGNSAKKDIETYLKKLKEFFQWIEKEYNVDVIIAAHPKSRIYKNKDRFNGFKVLHGKSVELVHGSKFVINEGTTAISYAIFFDKPLIFFTFKEINFFCHHLCAFTKELQKEAIDIDFIDKKKLDREFKNKNRYSHYKNNYMTYEDTNVDTYEMIEKEILKANARK